MRQQLVVFGVGSGEFALDILLTKEVVDMREITAVPETPDYVEGVMNLRGSLIPVLDFRKRLRAGKSAAGAGVRIIVANLEGKMVGLIVDKASEVIRVEAAMVEPVPDIINEVGADYISGVINTGDRFITLIDLKKALSGEVVCELERVIEILTGPFGRPGAGERGTGERASGD
jgi:purine-binding chemotaxis protein CheW